MYLKEFFSSLTLSLIFLISPIMSLICYCRGLMVSLVKPKFGHKGSEYFFLFFHQKVCYEYSLELPHGGNSNEYPQHIF